MIQHIMCQIQKLLTLRQIPGSDQYKGQRICRPLFQSFRKSKQGIPAPDIFLCIMNIPLGKLVVQPLNVFIHFLHGFMGICFLQLQLSDLHGK